MFRFTDRRRKCFFLWAPTHHELLLSPSLPCQCTNVGRLALRISSNNGGSSRFPLLKARPLDYFYCYFKKGCRFQTKNENYLLQWVRTLHNHPRPHRSITFINIYFNTKHQWQVPHLFKPSYIRVFIACLLANITTIAQPAHFQFKIMSIRPEALVHYWRTTVCNITINYQWHRIWVLSKLVWALVMWLICCIRNMQLLRVADPERGVRW